MSRQSKDLQDGARYAMNRFATLRPRRDLTLPLLAFAVPATYFVYRNATISCSSGRPCLDLTHTGYTLGVLAGSYLLAVVVLAVVDLSRAVDRHPYAHLAFRPTDRTLAVLAVLVGAIATYLLATLVTTIPAWMDLVLAPFGLIVGLPFALTSATMTVVANAASNEPSIPVQMAVVAVSLSLTGVWLFVLATGTAGLLESAGFVGVESR